MSKRAGFSTIVVMFAGASSPGLALVGVWMAIGGSPAWGQCDEQQKLTALDAAGGDNLGVSVSISGDVAVVGAVWDDDAGGNSGSAYIFRYNGINWVEEQKLTASDAAAGDHFGQSVSISGNVAVVGAYEDDDGGSDSGSAYVFRYNGATWVQEEKLIAQDAAEDDRFGISVGVYGDVAVVGAYGDDHPAPNSGSAYVFRHKGGRWGQEQQLAPADAAEDDFFGKSVSISGDVALVGAWWDDDAGATSGSAYIFRYVDTNWVEEQKLTAPDAAAGDQFGVSVSISGVIAVIGAMATDDAGTDSGSAYVFRRNGTTWQHEQTLTASDGANFHYFGESVSLSGNVAVVGAWLDDDAGAESGSAYMFRYNGTNWAETQKLTAFDAAAGDRFGVSASVSGSFAIVGAIYDDDAGDASGSAYVYSFAAPSSSGRCDEQQKLTAGDAAAGDQFGFGVAVSGDTAIFGASSNGAGVNSGSAYIYVHSGALWNPQQELTASDAAMGDFFGGAVSVCGDTAVVGAFDDDDAGLSSGSAYVFVRSGAVWTQQQKLTASDAAAGDLFGHSVSVSGNTLVIGAPFGDAADTGTAYVFVRSGNVWTQQQRLFASDAAGGDLFGYSVSLNGDTAVIGAHQENNPNGSDAGAAYVFVRSGGVWTEQQKLTASDGAMEDFLGRSVAVNGETVVAGAFGDDDAGTSSGSAYVFVRSGGVWTEQQKLTATNPSASDLFGWSVAVRGNVAVIGAIETTGVDGGRALVYTRSGGVWTAQPPELLASDPGANDQFGYSVSVHGDAVVVGAIANDDAGDASGSAYVFSCPPTLIYVDADAVGADDGTSWIDAYTSLKEALAVASGGGVDSIWVAAGTYYPDDGGGQTPGDRSATFQLLNGVALYGGFAGGETMLSQRDIEANETILSGDLVDDDLSAACNQDSPDCDSLGSRCLDGYCVRKQNLADNSHHVVTALATGPGTVLDGFTISSGNAADFGSFPGYQGGGLFLESGAPTIRNCVIEGNLAHSGGGVIVSQGSTPTFEDCSFVRNAANQRGGGAMHADSGSNGSYRRCQFTDNTAATGGGGLNCFAADPLVVDGLFANNHAFQSGGAIAGDGASSPIIINCRFFSNNSNTLGGAISLVGDTPSVSSPVIVNCLFSGNATSFGGGILLDGGTTATIGNCTFWNNSAAIAGGGILHGATEQNSSDISNCVLWNNTDAGGMDESAQIHTDGGTPVVNYSIVQGGWTGAGGTGIVNSDPLFFDVDGLDGILGTIDDDLRLLPGSPAIDAANNDALPLDTLDLDGDMDTGELLPVDLLGSDRRIDDPDTADTGNPGAAGIPVVDMGSIEYFPDCNYNGVLDDVDIAPGTFQGLGDLSGGIFQSAAQGVSDDGLVVVGASTSGLGVEAFRWESDTMQGLGDLPGGGFVSEAQGVSANGAVVVGRGYSAAAAGTGSDREAFRWENDVMTPIGDLPGGSLLSEATRIARNGSVIVGRGFSTGNEAFRWESDVMTPLGDLPGGIFDSVANAMSADHSVIVGYGNSSSGREAIKWTNGQPQGLGDLTGGAFDSLGNDISFDGNSIVGRGTSTSGQEAVRWNNGVIEGLGDLPGGAYESWARGVSRDGRRIVGYGTTALGQEAFIWENQWGMRKLSDVLSNVHGLDLTGWQLLDARDISDDGQFICGIGLNPMGFTEAWLARLPYSTDCNGNGVPDECDVAACLNTVDCNDCNVNGLPDECDIAPGGGSNDLDMDGIPDECVIWTPPPVTDELWSTAANWDQNVVPDNDPMNQFSVVIPGMGNNVVLDVDAEINSLRMRDGATLNVTQGNLTIETAAGIANGGGIVVSAGHSITSLSGPITLATDCSPAFAASALGGCTPPFLSVSDGAFLNASVVYVFHSNAGAVFGGVPHTPPSLAGRGRGRVEPADGPIAAMGPIETGGIQVAGLGLAAASIDLTGALTIDRDGLYHEDPATAASDTDAALSAGSVLITNALIGGGGMILTDSMSVFTGGDFSVIQSGDCSPALNLGGCTPPFLYVRDSASLTVGGSFIVSAGAVVQFGAPTFNAGTAVTSRVPSRPAVLASNTPLPYGRGSETEEESLPDGRGPEIPLAAPLQGSPPVLTLSGDFDIRSTTPGTFDFAAGTLVLNGTGQRVEAAGRDVGRSTLGLMDNFSVSELEVAPTASVTFSDTAVNILSANPQDEVLYVDSLIFRAGASVTLDGITLYYKNLIDEGGIVSLLNGGQLTGLGCVTVSECDDGDVCTFDACNAGFCDVSPTLYGDVNHDGSVDIFDILCVLDGFSGVFSMCAMQNVDLTPCPGGDGIIDVFDILGVLDAFAGSTGCCDS